MIQTNLVRVSYGSNQGLSGPRFEFFLGYELLKVYSKINTLPNSIHIIRSLGQISQTGNRKKVFPGQKNTSDLLQNISLCIYLHFQSNLFQELSISNKKQPFLGLFNPASLGCEPFLSNPKIKLHLSSTIFSMFSAKSTNFDQKRPIEI